MKMIQIDELIINLENVNEIEVIDGCAQITYNGEEPGRFSRQLSKEQAERLQHALEQVDIYVA